MISTKTKEVCGITIAKSYALGFALYFMSGAMAPHRLLWRQHDQHASC